MGADVKDSLLVHGGIDRLQVSHKGFQILVIQRRMEQSEAFFLLSGTDKTYVQLNTVSPSI